MRPSPDSSSTRATAVAPRTDSENRDAAVAVDVRGQRVRVAIALLALCLVGVGVAVVVRRDRSIDVQQAISSGRARIERDGLVYEFDAITQRARLTVAGFPDKDVLLERPADALRLRQALERELGQTLESLTEANRDTIDALKRMGYL